jgi:GTP-binding protein YchF
VLRGFEDADVSHVEGRIDPIRDAETVETELMLADLDSLERRRVPLEKRAKTGDKDAKLQLVLVDKALQLLREGRPARLAQLTPEEAPGYAQLQLLTAKPVLYVCNVDEGSAANGNAYSRAVEERARAEGAGSIVISAKIEAEIAALPAAERPAYLEEIGLSEPGLNRLIREGYWLLGLVTFFTAGPREAHAWTVPAGTKAPKAAGTIHTDFERGFIRAEVISYDDYIRYGGEAGAKEAGRMRLEGKDYIVKDGDVLLIRFAT